MQKKTITKIYKKYLQVKEKNTDKWGKDFFISFFSKKNVFFFLKRPSRGYLIARKIFNEYEIIALSTDLQFLRKGVASELLYRLIKKAKNHSIKKIFLEVSSKNLVAINMYNKLGFYQVGLRKKYYKTLNGLEDALIMIKEIG